MGEANAARLRLHALAYNLANVTRTLALPETVEHWPLHNIVAGSPNDYPDA
ncbi:MAG: hypothetical protein ACR2PO_06160 [Methyloligellaceae bacterium]